MGGGHVLILGGYSCDASAGLAVTFSLNYVSGMGGQLSPVYPQAINYLEAYGLDIGLLVNFGNTSLKFKQVMKPKSHSQSKKSKQIIVPTNERAAKNIHPIF